MFILKVQILIAYLDAGAMKPMTSLASLRSAESDSPAMENHLHRTNSHFEFSEFHNLHFITKRHVGFVLIFVSFGTFLCLISVSPFDGTDGWSNLVLGQKKVS